MDDLINYDLSGGQTMSLKHMFETDIDEQTINIDEMIKDSPYMDPNSPPIINEKLTLMSLNTQSLNSKIANLRILIEQCSSKNCAFDIIALQETWLSELNYHGPTLAIDGYNLTYSNKRLTSHGGLGFYINSNLEYIVRRDLDIQSNTFESLFIEVSISQTKLLVINIYRPPRDNMVDFINDLGILLNMLRPLQTQYSNIIVMGDFNVNFLKIKENDHVREVLDNFMSCGYLPNITLPSRISRYTKNTGSDHLSATLIDNIFSRLNEKTVIKSFILISDVSDHFPCCLVLDIAYKKQSTHKYILKRSDGPAQIEHLKTFIAMASMQDIISDPSRDVNYKYEQFEKIVSHGINQCLPTKQVRLRKNKHPVSPWLSNGLLRSINKRNKLYREMTKHHISDPAYANKRTNYITYRNILAKSIRIAKKEYYYNFFEKKTNRLPLAHGAK